MFRKKKEEDSVFMCVELLATLMVWYNLACFDKISY
jgi:hypothetical protein